MPAPVSAADLARQLSDLCGRHGIDLAGAAVLDVAPHADHWRRWLDRGLDGDLDYRVRTREERADPRGTLTRPQHQNAALKRAGANGS